MEELESRSDRRSSWIEASPAEVYSAMSQPERVARWWGPAGFRSTNHAFDLRPGGRWLLTMHGPDGTDYPNESRFTRVVADELFEVEHLKGHHFILTIELRAKDGGTEVRWRQTFDSARHFQPIAAFLAEANQQNLERLAAEVERGKAAPREVGP